MKMNTMMDVSLWGIIISDLEVGPARIFGGSLGIERFLIQCYELPNRVILQKETSTHSRSVAQIAATLFFSLSLL